MPPIAKFLLVVALIVLAVVIYGRVVGRRDSSRSLRDLSESARARIEHELQSGQKIAAIKTYRDATGAALADAKKAIDEWFVPGRGFGGRFGQDGDLTLATRKRISELVTAGRTDEAMALYAAATGAGQTEAAAIIRTWNTTEHI